jgi:hypothetical protein
MVNGLVANFRAAQTMCLYIHPMIANREIETEEQDDKSA